MVCLIYWWLYLYNVALPQEKKSEVGSIFPQFHKMISTQFRENIWRVGLDNARDYFNQFPISFFQKESIIYESSCVETPQQNGVAKQKNCHLLEVTHSLSFQANVPKFLWGEVVLTDVYLINRLLSKVFGNKSPIHKLSEFFPDLVYVKNLLFKVFGCIGYIHMHKQHRSKLDLRAQKCLYRIF